MFLWWVVNIFINFSKMLTVRDIEAPQIPSPPPSHTHTQARTRMCTHGNVKVDDSGLTVYTV